MKVESFDSEKHYEVISKWWEDQAWPVIPLGSLSKTGLVAHEDGVFLAASFLYATDSDMAILEWTVGNPDAPHESRGEGLDMVIQGLLAIAMGRGVKIVHTFSEHKRLIERYKEHDFVIGDSNMTLMLRSL